ncbi:MAG: hypothetical protein B7Z15_02170 [Rhizobiales bacterium 32-66-8]|nr:MAG: hypothetical protein B7Z15_02170 [Rhizobiales bacterium 32-66-8]
MTRAHLIHPGPITPERLTCHVAAEARALRFPLPPGGSLLAGVSAVLAARGIAAASLVLVGGTFARLAYCIAALNPDGPQVARYSDPILAQGPIGLIGANATYGADLDGSPMIHCHALFCDDTGRVFGGHVLPETAIVGATAPQVLARAFPGPAIARRYDPETMMAIFHPADLRGAHAPGC